MKSDYFTRKEFRCNCGCRKDTVDAYLLQVLEDVREYFGMPVRITSGNRCVKYNQKVGGSRKSQHLHSRAADFTVDNVPPHEVQEYLKSKYPGELGIGSYDTFTHVDTRTIGPARWVG